MKILFFGGRRHVLAELLTYTCAVDVNVVAGTPLHRDPIIEQTGFTLVTSRDEVIARILQADFDVLISNGLGYILPVSALPARTYVNVHPSFLPDLRGVDPIPGSILFRRDSGATCHLMDDGIDTGPIISRVRIPFSDDLTASLLYQLTYRAERTRFAEAWDRRFVPAGADQSLDGTVYFTQKAETRIIPFSASDDAVTQVVRAFDRADQGAVFFVGDREVRCHSCAVSTNGFLAQSFPDAADNEIVMVFEDTVVVKRRSTFLVLSELSETSAGWLGRPVRGR